MHTCPFACQFGAAGSLNPDARQVPQAKVRILKIDSPKGETPQTERAYIYEHIYIYGEREREKERERERERFK